MKDEAINKAVDKLLSEDKVTDFARYMVRKFGGCRDETVDSLRQQSLRKNFEDVADEFLELFGVEEVDEEELTQLATTLDSMPEEEAEDRGQFFAVQSGDTILFVDTEGYDYPRYKALLKIDDMKSTEEKELEDFEDLDKEFGEQE